MTDNNRMLKKPVSKARGSEAAGVVPYVRTAERPRTPLTGLFEHPVKEHKVGVSYIPVARSGELQSGERKAIDLNGRPMVLALIDGGYVAFSRQCPHENADLFNGPIVAGKVRCNNHGYCFDLQTGECVLPEGESSLTVLPVEERGDEICVRIEW